MTEDQAHDIIRQIASAESRKELQKLIGEYISVCDDVFFRVLSEMVSEPDHLYPQALSVGQHAQWVRIELVLGAGRMVRVNVEVVLKDGPHRRVRAHRRGEEGS